MKVVLSILLCMVGLMPHPAQAEDNTRFYRGEIEFVTLSGKSCSDKIKQGDRIPIKLAVRFSSGKIDGYYAGKHILTGHFSGDTSSTLSISYLGEQPSAQLKNNLSLQLSGDIKTGEIREKHLPESAPGCNFDLARLVLTPDSTGNSANAAYDKLAKRFKSEYESRQAMQSFDDGDMPKAIKHFETEIQLLEDIEGNSSEALIDPLLILSIAYCASDNFEKGKRLQDRVFAIPMEALKRKIWRTVVMRKLFARQAERLAQEGLHEKAVALLKMAIAAHPDLTGLYVHMAEMMIELDAPQIACSHIESVWKSQSGNNDLNNAQALCLARKSRELKDTDNLESSLAFMEEAWKVTNESLEILFELCGLYITKGSPERALALINENSEKIINEFGQKDFDRYQAIVYAALGRIAGNNKDFLIAESSLRTAAKLDPANVSYSAKLASVIHKSGRFEEAMRILAERQKNCPDPACKEQVTNAIEHERSIYKVLKKLY